ncbi:NAD(P)-binding protein [Trichodelitschia bisporula]|uniref:NAD(P)-binding protein n=1 Tax=Trichodelitschia bisporula TaxID=703511 RepID=A0A6G1HV57_9PEZI|nr:NAD(P)-binding protein [Trichodelitschia bisporula]
MATIGIIGGTRGLGRALVDEYTRRAGHSVYATARYTPPLGTPPAGLHWIGDVDIAHADAATKISVRYGEAGPLDVLIISAGYFGKEEFGHLDWEAEMRMYATSAVGPAFLVQNLVKRKMLGKGSKVVLITSESGSIGLRHESEGGGNYGHHASKAAENMVGKLLSLDLKKLGIAVAMVHPGFMRTEMTRGVGFDKYWDQGGAVEPAVAAKSLVDWIDTFDISKTGEFWAPRGAADIGTAEHVLGPKDKLPVPLQLPW